MKTSKKHATTLLRLIIDATNSRFVMLNSLKKLKIRYQLMCQQFLICLKKRNAYIQFF